MKLIIIILGIWLYSCSSSVENTKQKIDNAKQRKAQPKEDTTKFDDGIRKI